MSEWQSIETAPKDGSAVLLWCGEGLLFEPFQCVGRFRREETWTGWVDVYEGVDLTTPTHWMPLPAPPPPTNGEQG